MIENSMFNGATITVEKTDTSYHTYQDWGLYIANNDPIGDPEHITSYIQIPGRDGELDLSEAISGRPIYKSRQIKIWLAGLNEITEWDSVISKLRNIVESRICRIVFDIDPMYFWRGRVSIKEFKPVYEFGKFLLTMEEAEPYKYSIITSADPWLWDPFNFITDMITYVGAITVNGTASVTIPHGYMPTCPEFVVSEKTSGTVTVTYDGDTYDISQVTNRVPAILVGGDSDVELTFAGNAKVQIVYRSGSL